MMNKLILITLLYAQVDAINDLPNIIQQVAVSTTTTLTTNHQQQQQLLQIFNSIAGAFTITWTFFKNMFWFIFTCISTICSPFLWIARNLWINFVSKPFELFMHVIHILYPVILFCVAAICCGLFIGGCAGFAAEACSSLLISATWGPQPRQLKEEEEEEIEGIAQVEVDNTNEGTVDEDVLEEPPMLKSRASSIWESSSSFFGVQPQSQKKSEKEPLVQPKVELWREAVSSPVLIRRKKLSSSKVKDDSWGWDEDEDENDLYQRPSSSSSHNNKMYRNNR